MNQLIKTNNNTTMTINLTQRHEITFRNVLALITFVANNNGNKYDIYDESNRDADCYEFKCGLDIIPYIIMVNDREQPREYNVAIHPREEGFSINSIMITTIQ